ncbi:MAG: hypothetical protein BA870_10010 [Desulfuromonadales bacterium C00003094]|nr:MAG: hypothetical protein BA870_10010 [Desulfuromonadales bacterium C00003094]
MKKLWLFIATVVVFAVVVVIFGLSNLGPLIKKAVNTQGPKITGTELSLGDVDVSLLSGQVTLQKFLLGNPKGFSSPHAVAVKSIYVDVDEKSLTGDTIIIERIEVVGPDIYYEKGAGSDNFKALQRNIAKGAGGGSSKASADSGESSKKLVIRELVIRGGQVHLAVKGLAGQDLSAKLPDIRMTNIGGKNAGVSPAEAAREIFAVLYGEISSPDVSGVLTKGLQDLQGGAEQRGQKAVEGGGEKVVEEVEAATEKLKGLFN